MIPTAASFSPAHPLARRDVPVALARAFRFLMPFLEGVAETALNCAHRTSTVSPCAFCEQGGHLAAPYPSFSCRALREQGDRPSYPAPFFSILLVRKLRRLDLEWRPREGFEKREQVRFFFLCQTKWLHEGTQTRIGPTAFV